MARRNGEADRLLRHGRHCKGEHRDRRGRAKAIEHSIPPSCRSARLRGAWRILRSRTHFNVARAARWARRRASNLR